VPIPSATCLADVPRSGPVTMCGDLVKGSAVSNRSDERDAAVSSRARYSSYHASSPGAMLSLPRRNPTAPSISSLTMSACPVGVPCMSVRLSGHVHEDLVKRGPNGLVRARACARRVGIWCW
jgi:hypothetical protein